MSTSSSLSKTFESELKDMYDAEKRILDALEEMADEVENDELRRAFEEHREETDGQIDRLEQVFDMLDLEAGDEECAATKGIIEEHDEFKKKDAGSAEQDLFDIVAAQKTEHYEIATYGNLANMADKFDMDEIGDLLHQNLEEEQKTLDKLTQMANDYDYESVQSS